MTQQIERVEIDDDRVEALKETALSCCKKIDLCSNGIAVLDGDVVVAVLKASIQALEVERDGVIRASKAARCGLPGLGGGAPGARASDDEGLVPAADLDKFLDPDLHAAYAPPTAATTTAYLTSVKSQVLAEYGAFLASAFARPLELLDAAEPRRVDDLNGGVGGLDEATTYAGICELESEDRLDGADFHNNLAVYQNKLVLMKWNKNKKLLSLRTSGAEWKGRRLPDSRRHILVYLRRFF